MTLFYLSQQQWCVFIFNNEYLRLGQTICYDNYGGMIKRQLTVSCKVTTYLRVRSSGYILQCYFIHDFNFNLLCLRYLDLLQDVLPPTICL